MGPLSLSLIPFLVAILSLFNYAAKACFKNNRLALEHPVFVNRAITELITAGSIVECFSPPTVVNPLSVAIQSSVKKRLILDLRYPNSFLKKCKVKFEGVQDMLTVLSGSPQQYLFSFDSKSSYHHIEIFPDDQQFLGFSWTDRGVVKYFKFTVLPFGLATGPYIFTKLMRPLVKRWRASACKIVVYLDDGMGASYSFSSCVHQARVKSDLINSGLVPNDEKCIWCPNQQLTWLGLDWNLQFQTLSIPQKKIVKLLNSINDALASRKIKARQLALVTGLINSTSIVFGSICKLMTKALHRRINCAICVTARHSFR